MTRESWDIFQLLASDVSQCSAEATAKSGLAGAQRDVGTVYAIAGQS